MRPDELQGRSANDPGGWLGFLCLGGLDMGLRTQESGLRTRDSILPNRVLSPQSRVLTMEHRYRA